MKREIYFGISYDVLEIDNKKLTRTQMKREWKKFIKEREYSKIKTTFERGDGQKIVTKMYFKNGKLHNEFEPAFEIIHTSSIVSDYYLDGKKIDCDGKNWTEYVINHKRRKILKETLNEGIPEILQWN